MWTPRANEFDQAKARALLHQAGVTPPLELTMKLPPVPYARQGGEVIAAQLAKVGIIAKIENVEWAQWMSGVYGQKAYDLTIVNHVEPLDFGNFARPNYYWGYESKAFNELWAKINATVKQDERNKLMAEAQKMVADRSRGRLPVPADLDHRGQRAREGPVEGHAAVGQRPGGAQLGAVTALPALPLPAGVRSRRIDGVNGLSVHLLEAGFDADARPLLLLLHGFPELAYSWRR
jgi:hypothetical protein